jgi:hypothetical protein
MEARIADLIVGKEPEHMPELRAPGNSPRYDTENR